MAPTYVLLECMDGNKACLDYVPLAHKDWVTKNLNLRELYRDDPENIGGAAVTR